MRHSHTSSPWLLLTLYLVAACEQQAPLYPPAMDPETSLQRMILREGYQIARFVAEPMIMDPVEMAIDERGLLYVVEMPDYPYKPEPNQGKGKIKVLQDTDGDGIPDQATVFADGIAEATSVLPWDGGLLVAAAPHIRYMKDSTGDGKADIDEVLFSGFFENNSEAQITNLRLSVDNWIYAANFGQAGEITSAWAPDAPPLKVHGGDFRFRMDTRAYEVAAGPTQFGQALNDWGERFVTQNSHHIRQIVIPWRYLHRHDSLDNTQATFTISDHDPTMYQLSAPPYWREERTRRRQASYDENGLDRIEYAANNFTGATGSTFYDGQLFPDDMYGTIFTGDVAGNLVHVDHLIPREDHPAYIARRDPREATREFLMSADPWFRPVNFYVGPAGALYLIDYYRQHIETPLSIPEDLKADMDFYEGMDRGRIYRILPDSLEQVPGPFPDLGAYGVDSLARLLAHPGGWWRNTAHRILLTRRDPASIPHLEQMQSHEDPRARLHACYLLAALAPQSVPALGRSMLEDPYPQLRRHGLQLLETQPDAWQEILPFLEDPHPAVRFQAVLSLGNYDLHQVRRALQSVMDTHGTDEWYRKAVLSGVRKK